MDLAAALAKKEEKKEKREKVRADKRKYEKNLTMFLDFCWKIDFFKVLESF